MKTTVDVLVCCLAYGGNGGIATLIPEIAFWLIKLQAKLAKDERIGRVELRKYGDVPLTMERNRMVRDAIAGEYDIVLMLDSDNAPDLYLGKKPWAKAFWDTSFDFAFERLLRGVPTVVAAPYCGPNPHPANGGESTVYMFYAQTFESSQVNTNLRVEAYSREHASQMRGIQEVMAAPTGCILFTTSAFELLQFDRRPTSEILADYKAGSLTVEQCERQIRMQSYFFYEFTDGWQTSKASTEDVTATREIGMAGQLKHGEPVVFANWDAWAAHVKPVFIGMPEPIRMEQVSAVYQEAVLNKQSAFEEIRDVDFSGGRVDDKNDIQPAETPHETDEEIEDVVDEIDIPGVEIKARMICGRKVNSVGHVTPDHEIAVLTKLAENCGKVFKRPLRMLEVGSWVGESAVAFLGGAPKGSVIFCVDTWDGTPSDWTSYIVQHVNVMDWFVKNVGDLISESVFPMKGDSVSVAEEMSDSQELDLIFLDADHDYEAVRDDLGAWYRHLGSQGVFCGHDYCDKFPGVIQAVKEFCSEYGLKPNLIANTTIWWVTRTALDRARAAQAVVEVPAQGTLFGGEDVGAVAAPATVA